MKLIDIMRYIAYLLILATLLVGTKMVHMINAGEEIPSLMLTLHSHTLCIAFLALLIWSDIRIREKEVGTIKYAGEISLGLVIIGLVMTVIGFSLMLQGNFPVGSPMSYYGEALIIFGTLTFLLEMIISEVIK